MCRYTRLTYHCTHSTLLPAICFSTFPNASELIATLHLETIYLLALSCDGLLKEVLEAPNRCPKCTERGIKNEEVEREMVRREAREGVDLERGEEDGGEGREGKRE